MLVGNWYEHNVHGYGKCINWQPDGNSILYDVLIISADSTRTINSTVTGFGISDWKYIESKSIVKILESQLDAIQKENKKEVRPVAVPIIEAASDVEIHKILRKAEEPDRAKRFNSGKPRWSLLHFNSLEPLVRAMEYGEGKYGRDNWKKTMDLKELIDCNLRHLTKLSDGEEFDKESGVHHMGHVIANSMMYMFHYNLINNRDERQDD